MYNGVGSGSTAGSSVMPNFFSVAGNTETPVGFAFKAQYINNYSEFLNLFKVYKLNCVVVKVRLERNLNTTSTVDDGNPVYCHWAYDQTAGSSATQATLRDYRSYKNRSLRWDKWLKIKVIPRVAIQTAGTNFGVGNPWIHSGYDDQDYYGLKMTIENSSNVLQVVNFDYIFYFSTKVQA